MEDEMKTCAHCKYFNRFYVCEMRGYKRTEYGRCMKAFKTITENDDCAKFEKKSRPKLSQRILNYKINALLTDISEIRVRMETYYDVERKDENL